MTEATDYAEVAEALGMLRDELVSAGRTVGSAAG
jgi:hypothetical protein